MESTVGEAIFPEVRTVRRRASRVEPACLIGTQTPVSPYQYGATIGNWQGLGEGPARSQLRGDPNRFL